MPYQKRVIKRGVVGWRWRGEIPIRNTRHERLRGKDLACGVQERGVKKKQDFGFQDGKGKLVVVRKLH